MPKTYKVRIGPNDYVNAIIPDDPPRLLTDKQQSSQLSPADRDITKYLPIHTPQTGVYH